MEMNKHYTLLDLKLDFLIFKHKASNILKGLWYWLVGKNELTRMKRAEHCNECLEKNTFTCNECGCFLQLKLRVKDEECPLGKW